MPAPEETPNVDRSAITGRFVSEEEAAANPDTTVHEVQPSRGGFPEPTVGRVVHYVSYGTPKGEYKSMCRGAQITEVDGEGNVGLMVFNPLGIFMHPILHENGPCRHDEDDKTGGTWHWPERV